MSDLHTVGGDTTCKFCNFNITLNGFKDINKMVCFFGTPYACCADNTYPYQDSIALNDGEGIAQKDFTINQLNGWIIKKQISYEPTYRTLVRFPYTVIEYY